jgi:hypothetical protein
VQFSSWHAVIDRSTSLRTVCRREAGGMGRWKAADSSPLTLGRNDNCGIFLRWRSLVVPI